MASISTILIYFYFLFLFFNKGNFERTNSTGLCYGSCLHVRSSCLRSINCRPFLDKFESSCGYNVEHCTGSSPSDCVHTLRQLRHLFDRQSCICYEALGSQTQCQWFRQAMYSNPCEKRLVDVGAERRINQPEEYFHYGLESRGKNSQGEEKSEIFIDMNGVTEPSTPKRTTRSPIQDRIREWKRQLSGELETKAVIRKMTCNEALYEVCLRHVSCKQLWRLFRENCDVDGENNCRMQHRETCWQSFEGLTWTGLGSCHCNGNHSDCHWIRLHTNYNKCIYEISQSGDFPAFVGVEGRRISGPPISPPAPVPPPSAPPRKGSVEEGASMGSVDVSYEERTDTPIHQKPQTVSYSWSWQAQNAPTKVLPTDPFIITTTTTTTTTTATTTTTTTTTSTTTTPIPTTLAPPILRPVDSIPRIHPQPTVQEVTKPSKNKENDPRHHIDQDRTRYNSQQTTRWNSREQTTRSPNIKARVSTSWEKDEDGRMDEKFLPTTIAYGPTQAFVEFRPRERVLREF